jgi:hypothetical protein
MFVASGNSTVGVNAPFDLSLPTANAADSLTMPRFSPSDSVPMAANRHRHSSEAIFWGRNPLVVILGCAS